MAGDWIKMTVHLDTDPSVILIAAALDLDELAVVGRLWKVWAWADQHSVDGNAVRVTTDFLDRITYCPGFVKAMRDAGWLEGRNGALTFPHFRPSHGHPAKKRALTKDRVNEHRNASRVTTALPEKRRVEKKPSPLGPPAGGRGEGDDDFSSQVRAGTAALSPPRMVLAEELYALYPRKISGRSRAIETICGALRRTDADSAPPCGQPKAGCDLQSA